MLGLKDFRTGSVLKYKDEPHVVTFYQHTKTARGQANVRTKLKSLVTGNVVEKTFGSSDKIEAADLERQQGQFLYKDDSTGYFMNNSSYEQFEMPLENLAGHINFLKDGTDVDVLYFEGQPVSISLPNKMTFEVIETVPGVKGDTAQGRVTKAATIETGYELQVPLFIKQGESIIINTETGEYSERAQ